MSRMEELKAEGREEGRIEGKEEGRIEGKEEAKAEFISQLNEKDKQLAEQVREIEKLKAMLAKN